MFTRRAEQTYFLPLWPRRFSSTSCRFRKHADHYATLSVPRTATRAQIKTSYYQLSKKYHPDVAKDNASQAKFHAVSEAYAILCDDRKRREYDRSLGSPFHAPHMPGQHPQATTTQPSQQPGLKHLWPTHPRNRARDPTGRYSRTSHPYEPARANSAASQRPRPGSEAPNTDAESHADPFSNPFVQRATGYRRSDAASQPGETRSNYHYRQGGFQSAASVHWTASGGNNRRGSAADGRPTQDEAAAESSGMRALGATGLVGVILLLAAIGGSSKRTPKI